MVQPCTLLGPSAGRPSGRSRNHFSIAEIALARLGTSLPSPPPQNRAALVAGAQALLAGSADQRACGRAPRGSTRTGPPASLHPSLEPPQEGSTAPTPRGQHGSSQESIICAPGRACGAPQGSRHLYHAAHARLGSVATCVLGSSIHARLRTQSQGLAAHTVARPGCARPGCALTYASATYLRERETACGRFNGPHVDEAIAR